MSNAIGLSLTPAIITDTVAEKLEEIPSFALKVNESSVALSDELT